VVVVVPLLWTALAAVGIVPNNNTSPPSWVVAPSLDHLAGVSVVEPAFWQELATSVGVSAAAALLATALSFLAAYGIARSTRPALRRLSPGLLVLASLPVMAYVLPLSDLLRRLGLLDSLPGLTFAEAAATAPLAVYVLSAHLAGSSRDTDEAARLEGASLSRLLRSVVLPAAAPIVAATAIVLFVLDWNMLLIPLVLTGIDVRTLPVILTDFFTLEREVDWPTAAAALTISLVPLLILVGLFHRLLERFSLGGDATEPG
jgi:ABC-type glycerol-3-phosphate transport system permease component